MHRRRTGRGRGASRGRMRAHARVHHGSKKQNSYYELKSRRWYFYYLSQKDENGKIKVSGKGRRKIGLLDEHDEEVVKRGLVIQFTPPKLHLFSYFHSIIDFMQYEANFPLDSRGFFETVLGTCRQKPHFDLDINLIEHAAVIAEVQDKTIDQLMADMITYLVWAIQQSFQEMDQTLNLEKDILLFSSHGEHKRSYHLIVDNYCHRNCDEANRFYRVVVQKVPSFFHRWIDHTVYKSLQQFRMEGSQKVGSGRVKRLVPTWMYGDQEVNTNLDFHWLALEQLSDEEQNVIWADQSKLRYAILHASLLMNTYYCTVLPDFAALLPIENIRIPGEYNGGVTDDRALAAVQLLAESMGCSLYSPKFPFRFSKVVAGGLIVLRRNLPSYCDVCERRHESENPFMYIVKGSVFFDCRRNQDGLRKKIGYVPGEEEEAIAAAADPSPEELSTMIFTIPTVDSHGRVIADGASSSSASSSSGSEGESPPDMFTALDDMARGITYPDGKAQVKDHRFIKQVTSH